MKLPHWNWRFSKQYPWRPWTASFAAAALADGTELIGATS
jgi:hypothetical protein